MKPVLAMTRPDGPAQDFAAEVLTRVGEKVDVVFSPAYEIVKIDASPECKTYDHLIFTSRNGVAMAQAHRLRSKQKVWCVGAATAQAANDAGYAVSSANGDALELISLVRREYVSGDILHVAGKHLRVNVTDTLRAADISCETFVAYDQKLLPASAELRSALAGTVPVVLPLFSQRATMVLDKLEVRAQLNVVSISENVSNGITINADATYIVAVAPNKNAMLDSTCDVLQRLLQLERGAHVG